MMKWFKENIAHLLSAAGLFLTFCGLMLVDAQLKQGNEHQKWNNYNQLNIHYSTLYRDIPEDLEAASCKRFDELTPTGKKWIRSYFNLYSEEHYLFLEHLIPNEMWTKRIDNGVEVNMLSYPVIVEGYEHWKKLGSFTHPKEFIPFVDTKIANLQARITGVLAQCNKPVTLNPAVNRTLRDKAAQRRLP
jgi:hypothetical protein